MLNRTTTYNSLDSISFSNSRFFTPLSNGASVEMIYVRWGVCSMCVDYTD